MIVNDFVKKVQEKEIDIVSHIEGVIKKCRKINKEYNYFNAISEELALQQAEALSKEPKGKIAGVAVSIKDSICVKGVESTAGSRILRGYRPLFDATVVERIKKEGGIIIGKTSQDEFGFGGFSVNVGHGFKVPLNPFDRKRTTGGSSGGAAGLSHAADFPHIAIGESTGGSIVEPASFCGVSGICPTFGRVSNNGVIHFSNSMDKLGPLGKSIADTSLMLSVISGFDEKESTTVNAPVDDYPKFAGKGVKGMKIGIVREAFGEGTEKEVEDKVWAAIKKIESEGASYEEISLEIPIKYGLEAYYIIAPSEASTNLAKFCGMRYGMHEKLEGNFNKYFTKVRSMHFGDEVKRRIMIGTFARMAGCRDAYYIKAAKVRTMIINEYKRAFRKFDAVVMPTVPVLPPKFEDISRLTPLQNYKIDIMTVGPNIAGMPHANVPVGFAGKLPVGMLLVADHLQEKKIVQIGSAAGMDQDAD